MILDRFFDSISGKLEKMIIQAFENAEEARKKSTPAKEIRAFINPESYTLSHSAKFNTEEDFQGASGQKVKFTSIQPSTLTFDFLFDNSGIIDGDLRDILKSPNANISNEIEEFRKTLVGYEGSIHQPYIIKLIWGTLLFIGRATNIDISYKLFNPDGQPIRAVAKVTFVGTIDANYQAAKDKRASPDLTHIFKVKSGDTLPLLCKKFYGNSKYYLQVAAINGLGNFRHLEPGTELVFPPIDKMKK